MKVKELQALKSTREIKSRDLELGSHSYMDCLAVELFLQHLFFGHCLCDFVK